MAIYPCDYDRRRYPLPQQSMYFTTLLGSTADTYAMRLCPVHFKLLWSEVKLKMAEVLEDSQTSTTCENCDQVRTATLFAKIYPRGEEFRQYVVDLCASCLGALGNDWQIYNGRRLTARLDPLLSV